MRRKSDDLDYESSLDDMDFVEEDYETGGLVDTGAYGQEGTVETELPSDEDLFEDGDLTYPEE